MQRSKPPFRADHVGSILRSEKIKAARKLREEGAITAEELTDREDEEIVKIVRRQEDIGLRLATDGQRAAPLPMALRLQRMSHPASTTSRWRRRSCSATGSSSAGQPERRSWTRSDPLLYRAPPHC